MAKLRRRFTWLWVAWLSAFVVIEAVAIVQREPGDTLSEHVWYIARVSVVWWVLAGFLIWLVAHLLGPRSRLWVDSWRRRSGSGGGGDA